MQTTGGVLFLWESACDILEVGEIMAEIGCLGKMKPPLAYLFSLAGYSTYQQSSTVQLQQVTIRKNRTSDLYDQSVRAENPQPRFGESSEKIDLNELLITNEIATFFCRVSGRSMEPHMREAMS